MEKIVITLEYRDKKALNSIKKDLLKLLNYCIKTDFKCKQVFCNVNGESIAEKITIEKGI